MVAPALGGMYDAAQQPDGTWTIYNVEVMGELPAGARRNKKPIGPVWMRAAVDAMLRDAPKHLPAVFVRHHDIGVEPIHAGLMYPKKDLGRMRVEGREMACILADIINVPPDVFAQIEKLQLPFRSPEVADWDKPELNGLALLPTEAPFFKMPMTSVRRKPGRPARHTPSLLNERMAATDRPALAVRSTSRGGMILFNLGGAHAQFCKGESSMATDADKDGKVEVVVEEDEANTNAETDPNKMAESDAPPSWAAAMLATLEAIAAKVGAGPTEGQMEEGGEAAAGADEQDKINRMPAEQAMSQKPGAKMSKTEVALTARMTSLEGELQKRDRSSKMQAMIAGAREKLGDRVLSLPDTLDKTLEKMASAGQEILDGFVDNLIAGVPETPGTFTAFEQRTGRAAGEHDGSAEATDKVLAKFRAKGPAQAEKAKIAVEKFRKLQATRGMRSSLEAFVNLEVNGPPVRMASNN